MSEGKKSKYLSKTVKFAGKEITLFSIDGVTWSTRRQELLEIKERQEREKVSFAAVKEEDGQTKVIAKPVPNAAKDVDGDDDIEDDLLEGDDLPDYDYPIEEDADEKPVVAKRSVKPGKAPVRTASSAVVKEKVKVPVKDKKSKKEEVKPIAKTKPAAKPAPKAKKSPAALKIAPKKRATGKPQSKTKVKPKGKKKAA